MTDEEFAAIKKQHDIAAQCIRSDDRAVAPHQFTEHDHRGILLEEVERLREGIRRFRVSQGPHLVRAWADHLDELVAPDTLWKKMDDINRKRRGLE